MACRNPEPQTVQPSECRFRTEKIGVIEIDTGSLIIADPARLGDLSEAIDEMVSKTDFPIHRNILATEPTNKRPYAIYSMTGFGDGKFPVFAEIMKDDDSETVIALHIHLYPEYSLPSDDDGKEIKKMESDYLESMNG